MRPYFYNRNVGYQAAETRRHEAYRMSQQRVAKAEKLEKTRGVFKLWKRVVRFFTGKRQLALWELKAKAAAQDKRLRRQARNLRWWANDRAWLESIGQ